MIGRVRSLALRSLAFRSPAPTAVLFATGVGSTVGAVVPTPISRRPFSVEGRACVASGTADSRGIRPFGETPNFVSSALGGGLWVSWVDAYMANLAVARSAEATSLYFGLGFSF